MNQPEKQDVVLSGGFGKLSNSARAGFLPIGLERTPLESFASIPIYLRTIDSQSNHEKFHLYCSADMKFSEAHRQRLIKSKVKFVYIAIADHARFRRQTEDALLKTVEDSTLSTSIKAEIVYETSVELVNELLSDPDLKSKSNRLAKVASAITRLVLKDQNAFAHLFATSHHDFYTATHMVNVATWMVPLAYAMGYTKSDELNKICQAGLLHDVGKVFVPSDVLNNKGKLTTRQWEMLKQHPEFGLRQLEISRNIDPIVLAVTYEHHERNDGSGYPRGIRGEQMHPVSRICAVVDSFDAMTAFRPFKTRTMTVSEAVAILIKETPQKYDQNVLDAWLKLLRAAEQHGVLSEPIKLPGQQNHRAFPRFPIDCPAKLNVLERITKPDGTPTSEWTEQPATEVIVHNISRAGAAFITKQQVQLNEYVRLCMKGKATMSREEHGIVVRCRAYKDGWFEVGMKFVDVGVMDSEVGSEAA